MDRQVGEHGLTPLMYGLGQLVAQPYSISDQVDALRLLLNHNANTILKDHRGKTALDIYDDFMTFVDDEEEVMEKEKELVNMVRERAREQEAEAGGVSYCVVRNDPIIKHVEITPWYWDTT